MPKAISEALTRAATGQFTQHQTLDLDAPHKYVILSDQHKGAGGGADEFRLCKDAYVDALNHYQVDGFTLILLGDAEELWEQGFRSVRRTYDDVLSLEGSFGFGRYIRIWGNHDDYWMSDKKVRKHLSPYMPGGGVHEGLRFEVVRKQRLLGTLLLLHGHQGTLGSDKIRFLSKLVLRPYRYLQRWFGIGKTTPAKDFCLRGDHERDMYEWAAAQNKMVLIAGHTHRPVWKARTHLQKLEEELAQMKTEPKSDNRDQRIKRKEAEIEGRKKKTPPCNDTVKDKWCYFNTGCCKFKDGEITGMEIESGQLRLIKWTKGPSATRVILEEAPVADVLTSL